MISHHVELRSFFDPTATYHDRFGSPPSSSCFYQGHQRLLAHLETSTPPRWTSTVECLDLPGLRGVIFLADMEHVALSQGPINIIRAFWCYPNNPLVFITISLSPLFMTTRSKNKSTHPGLPDMTPSQLSSAGLSRTPAPRRKKATKDQQIAALQDELRSIQELLSKVPSFYLIYIHPTLTNPFVFQKNSDSRAVCCDRAQDADGDTEPGTDVEAETATAGSKRKAPTTIATPKYMPKFSLHFLHFNGAHQVEAVKSYGSI